MRHADSIRLVRMVRTIGGQTWLHAMRTRWQRAMRPIGLAVNLIHHPDEPDGVRPGATRAGIVWDAAGDTLQIE